MNNLDLTKTKQENPDSKRNLLSHIHIEQLYTHTHTTENKSNNGETIPQSTLISRFIRAVSDIYEKPDKTTNKQKTITSHFRNTDKKKQTRKSRSDFFAI